MVVAAPGGSAFAGNLYFYDTATSTTTDFAENTASYQYEGMGNCNTFFGVIYITTLKYYLEWFYKLLA